MTATVTRRELVLLALGTALLVGLVWGLRAMQRDPWTTCRWEARGQSLVTHATYGSLVHKDCGAASARGRR